MTAQVWGWPGQLVPWPGKGMAAYAWHMFVPASCTASAQLPTCSPPLCAQQGLLRQGGTGSPPLTLNLQIKAA